MTSRQYPLLLFSSTLIVALTGPECVAFTIIPSSPSATQFYRESSTFLFPRSDLETTTVIDKNLWFQPIKRGGTFQFNTVLRLWSVRSSQGFFGWKFKPAQRDLEGSFEVVTYQACAPQDGCGGASTPIPDQSPSSRGVGSLFHLKYHPLGNDPKPGNGKLHWIQMVQANYGRGLPGVPLIPGIPFIDNGGRKQNPYYDYPGYRFAGEDFFMDRPYSVSSRRNNYFYAQLYLVQETTPPRSRKREVTIYNGIKWGWENTVTRRVCPAKSSSDECTPPPPPPPPPPPCNGGSGGGGCNFTTASLTTRELPLLESDGLDAVNSSRDTLAQTELAPNQSDFFDRSESSFNSDDINLFEDTFASSYSEDETDWFDNEDVSFFDIDGTPLYDSELADLFNSDSDESPKSVPEPTSIFGLLVLGIVGFIHTLKNRFNKKR